MQLTEQLLQLGARERLFVGVNFLNVFQVKMQSIINCNVNTIVFVILITDFGLA
jgi:hypothetical protein